MNLIPIDLGLEPIATEAVLDELGLEHRKKGRKGKHRRKKGGRGKHRRRKHSKKGRMPGVRARFRSNGKAFGCYPKRVRTRGRKTTVRGFCRRTDK